MGKGWNLRNRALFSIPIDGGACFGGWGGGGGGGGGEDDDGGLSSWIGCCNDGLSFEEQSEPPTFLLTLFAAKTLAYVGR